MLKKLCALAAVLLLAGCGGGGGGSGGGSGGGGSPPSPPPPPPPPTVNNFVSVTIDGGPAGLGYLQSNVAYVTITLCAPGSTTNCQTIDHVQVDTGSVGLRLIGSVLNSSLLSALPLETDASSNPVGECYQYIDGYVFGSVRQADLTIGGEKVSNMPFHVIADSGAFSNVPASCSKVGGSNLRTVQDFGANGIIGIGVTATDCGFACTSGTPATLSQGNPIYFDCPSSGCGTEITRAASASAPYQQVINPVAAMSMDNNGTVLVLPAQPSTGAATATGTLYFGIGTQTNNGLGSAQIYTTDGNGFVTVTYKGNSLPFSFLDSGSSLYFFEDSAITGCSSSQFNGFYCPLSPLPLNPTITGANGATVSGAFTLYNAQTQFASNGSVIPGVGGNPSVFFPNIDPTFFSQSLDYGLPFFYGRSVYTAIAGRNAGGVAGPYYAF